MCLAVELKKGRGGWVPVSDLSDRSKNYRLSIHPDFVTFANLYIG